MAATGYTGQTGGGTGAVESVNGKAGVVVLAAADVGADPAGTATAGVAAHVAAVDPHADRAYAASQVTAHAAAADPHGDRAYAAAQVAALAPSAWLPATLGTGVTWAGAPYPTPASQLDPALSRVYLRGRISWAAALTSGATLLVIDAAHRPVETQTISVRTGAPSNLAAVLTIDTAGVVALAVATGNAGYLGLDGLNFYRGASS
jgi:hypothetical protein